MKVSHEQGCGGRGCPAGLGGETTSLTLVTDCGNEVTDVSLITGLSLFISSVKELAGVKMKEA